MLGENVEARACVSVCVFVYGMCVWCVRVYVFGSGGYLKSYLQMDKSLYLTLPGDLSLWDVLKK